MVIRSLSLGILLGAWVVTLLPNWLERHSMSSFVNSDLVFYVVTGLIVVLLFSRQVLKILDHIDPRIGRWWHEFWRPIRVDSEEHRRREAERERKSKERRATKNK